MSSNLLSNFLNFPIIFKYWMFSILNLNRCFPYSIWIIHFSGDDDDDDHGHDGASSCSRSSQCLSAHESSFYSSLDNHKVLLSYLYDTWDSEESQQMDLTDEKLHHRYHWKLHHHQRALMRSKMLAQEELEWRNSFWYSIGNVLELNKLELYIWKSCAEIESKLNFTNFFN